MKDIDQKKLDALGKKVRAALEAMLQLARDAGVEKPMIYIESEQGVYVLDQDHPDFMSERSARSQKAIVCKTFGALPGGTDMGAW